MVKAVECGRECKRNTTEVYRKGVRKRERNGWGHSVADFMIV
jgi:hypothetical protein